MVTAFGVGLLAGSRIRSVDDSSAVGPAEPASKQPSTTLATSSLSPVVLLDGCETIEFEPIACVVGAFVIDEQIEVKLEYAGRAIDDGPASSRVRRVSTSL